MLRWQRLLVGGFFVFLSIDEYVGLHEGLTALNREGDWLPMFNDHGAWIIPYFIAGLTLLLLLANTIAWAWRHDAQATKAALCGAVIYAVAALGLELGSYYLESGTLLKRSEVVVEEWMEMLGVSMILYGALRFRCTLRRA